MPFEFLDGSVLESRLVFFEGRIGEDDVTSSLEFKRPFEGIDLDLAANILRALALF
jgi:hypothetical protein